MSLTSYRTAPPREDQGSEDRWQRTDRGRVWTSWGREASRDAGAARAAAHHRQGTAPGLTASLDQPLIQVCRVSSDLCHLNFALGSWLDLAVTRSPTPSWGSTLGAAEFHGRVRNGVGWDLRAVTTRSSQEPDVRCQMSDGRERTAALGSRPEGQTAPAAGAGVRSCSAISGPERHRVVKHGSME
jgi:hypothetical protein